MFTHMDGDEVMSTAFQVTLPAFIRERARLNVGDILLWEFDENSKTLTVIKKPSHFTSQLAGLGKHLWENGLTRTPASIKNTNP